MVGIVYVGDSSITLEETDGGIDELVPRWFICAVNPGAVTLLSFYLSIAVLAFAETLSAACAEARKDAEVKTWHVVASMCVVGMYKALNSVRTFLRRSPCFCATLCLWVAHGVVSWGLLLQRSWGSTKTGCNTLPASNTTSSSTSIGTSAQVSDIASSSDDVVDDIDDEDQAVFYTALIIANVALVVGVSMKAFPTHLGNRHPTTIATPLPLSDRRGIPSPRTCEWLEDSYMPSLLVGWGVGYWATSLLLGGSLYQIWWNDAPLALEIISYLVLPCFFIAVVFMMADDDFLGTKFAPLINSTTVSLVDKRGVWYWILATAVRDILLIWVLMWNFLVPCLNNI